MKSEGDPLDAIPASPSQIYRNMLILEESLRAQHTVLRRRRFQYASFFALLLLWTAYFYYGTVSYPSVYAYVHALHKLALALGIVTIALFYMSGLYAKTIVHPRRFVANTNKGLRQFNLRLVLIPAHPARSPSALAARFVRLAVYKFWYRPLPPSSSSSSTTSSSSSSSSSSAPSTTTARRRRSSSSASTSSGPPPQSHPFYHYFCYHYKPPGGDLVKLVMLPKPFPPDVREGWELYRSEYWAKENDRRQARASGRIPCSCVYPPSSSATASSSSSASKK
ncbi:Sporulation/nuclear morphology [Myxozyma melibiosi]|uniref:Sporulation/nuclear morphology n=1 Tax=Myxozyma melibiosi TaxID=54550 RepID=A0ABR1F1A6_9ASCO